MKKRFLSKSVLACALTVGLLAACGSGGGSKSETSQSGGGTSGSESQQTSQSGGGAGYEIKVWAAEAVKDLFQTHANAWAANMKQAGVDINVTVQAVGEGDAASNMISDVQAGADLYCFAQDQLSRLRSAGALTEIVDPNIKADIKAQNDEVSYGAACVGDSLVALPLTSDNGYFMYYDTSVFEGHEEALEDMTQLIALCKEQSKTIYFDVTGSGWYNAAFFMGFGCESTWETNTAGLFVDYTDTYNTANGLKAGKAMYELIKEDNVFVSGSDASKAFDANAAVCISGTWDSAAAKQKLGEHFGATDLPSVTVDGVTKHLGSFFGCKLLGIKPQTDAVKGAYVTNLARYFSAKEAQLDRYTANGWGPSNKEAQQDPAVQADVALTALRKQNEFSVMQGQYPDGWWTATQTLASNIQKSDGSDSAIKGILATYAASIDSFING